MDPDSLLDRLQRATNDHDVDAIVACFSPEFRNETPAHPSRGFGGREQVGKNWEVILAAVPDLTARVLRSSLDGHALWTEWEHRGTRRDGRPHLMRGVVIFGVRDGLFDWARFYLEPVQDDGLGVDEFVRRQLGSAVVA